MRSTLRLSREHWNPRAESIAPWDGSTGRSRSSPAPAGGSAARWSSGSPRKAHSVVAADVNEERAAETAKLAGASYEVVDVSQPEQVERLVAAAVERHGKLTTMCNNAAISIPAT